MTKKKCLHRLKLIKQELIALNYILHIKKSISNFVLYSASYQNKVKKEYAIQKNNKATKLVLYTVQYNKNTNTS